MSNCPESSAVVETSTTLNDVLSGEKAIPEHWFDENGPAGGLNNEIIQKVALASGQPAWIVLSAITGLRHAQRICSGILRNGGVAVQEDTQADRLNRVLVDSTLADVDLAYEFAVNLSGQWVQR